MKKLNNDMYILVKGSLNGNIAQEKLVDVENRIFMNDMIDRWTKEDYEYNDILYQLKDELKGEINGKQN